MNNKDREKLGVAPLVDSRPDLKDLVENQTSTIFEHKSNSSDKQPRGEMPPEPEKGRMNASKPWRPKANA